MDSGFRRNDEFLTDTFTLTSSTLLGSPVTCYNAPQVRSPFDLNSPVSLEYTPKEELQPGGVRQVPRRVVSEERPYQEVSDVDGQNR